MNCLFICSSQVWYLPNCMKWPSYSSLFKAFAKTSIILKYWKIQWVWKFSVAMYCVTYLIMIHFILPFYVLMLCVSMSVIVCQCLSLSWHAMVFHFARSCWLLSGVVYCFVLCFLYTCGSCKWGMCHLLCGVNVIVTNFVIK